MTSGTDPKALADCPFCSSPGYARKHEEIPNSFMAGCSDEDCIAHVVAFDFQTVEAAIAAWNSRRGLDLQDIGYADSAFYAPNPPRESINAEMLDLQSRLSEAEARVKAAEVAEDEAYELGKRDGYERAVQDIDLLTGGDGEYRWSPRPERNTPDPDALKGRIVARFSASEAQVAALKAELKELKNER